MLNVEAGLLDYMARYSGACRLELLDVPSDLAMAALDAAGAVIENIPHPEEPDTPLPSYISEPEAITGGASFWFDAADAEVYEGLLESVLSAVVDAIEASGVASGRLVAPKDAKAEMVDVDEASHAAAHSDGPTISREERHILGIPESRIVAMANDHVDAEIDLSRLASFVRIGRAMVRNGVLPLPVPLPSPLGVRSIWLSRRGIVQLSLGKGETARSYVRLEHDPWPWTAED